MELEVALFFQKMPQALPVFEAFESKIMQAFPDTAMKVQKTQITFTDNLNFAVASLPLRFTKRHPDALLLVTFVLSHKAEDPRIAITVEPYPDRWTHHVLVSSVSEIDDQLMAWIQEAHAYAQLRATKRKGRAQK